MLSRSGFLDDDRRGPILGVVEDQDDGDQEAGPDELRQVERLVKAIWRRRGGDESRGDWVGELSDRGEGRRRAAQRPVIEEKREEPGDQRDPKERQRVRRLVVREG